MKNNQKIESGVVHNVPADFKQALKSNPDLLAKWNSLTPLARNEWICWIVSPTLAETRQKHITRAIEELLAGKRRPCCWYGCIHRKDKAISPSVKAVVIDRKSKK